VEGKTSQGLRGELARVIVESGWDLNELRSAAVSLEEVFLQLTGADVPEKVPAKSKKEKLAMAGAQG
jgi:hypothetical protein